MPEEPCFAEMLSVGTVVVDVGYDNIGMPTAGTLEHLLEGAALGGEISVTLHRYTGDPATAGTIPHSSPGRFSPSSPDRACLM